MNRLYTLAIFDSMAAEEYRESGYNAFTLEEVLGVFHEYFRAYNAYMREPHPVLRRWQIRRIIEDMNSVADPTRPGEYIELYPDCYPYMIEAYFDTYFRGCDRNINHFFSGHIRAIKFYEACY